MSASAMKWAWEQKTRSSGQRLVLLALAEFTAEHDDPEQMTDGWTCWPKIATVAEMTGLTNSTVRGHYDSLVADGLAEKMGRRLHGKRAGAVVMRLSIDRAPTDRRSKSADGQAVKTADGQAVYKSACRQAVYSPMSNDQELNAKNEQDDLVLLSEVAPRLDRPTFDDFYSRWPKKQDKEKARQRWDALGADEQQAAMDALPAWEARAEAEGATFIPMPSTWLFNKRWLDEHVMVAKQPRTIAEKNTEALAAFKAKHG